MYAADLIASHDVQHQNLEQKKTEFLESNYTTMTFVIGQILVALACLCSKSRSSTEHRAAIHNGFKIFFFHFFLLRRQIDCIISAFSFLPLDIAREGLEKKVSLP
jgi:hypothetical protein